MRKHDTKGKFGIENALAIGFKAAIEPSRCRIKPDLSGFPHVFCVVVEADYDAGKRFSLVSVENFSRDGTALSSRRPLRLLKYLVPVCDQHGSQ